MVEIGDTVIWVDEDLVQHNCKVTKIKQDNQLDLKYDNTVITSGAHKLVQHPDYGCYWMEIK